jgi:hypothetical protein
MWKKYVKIGEKLIFYHVISLFTIWRVLEAPFTLKTLRIGTKWMKLTIQHHLDWVRGYPLLFNFIHKFFEFSGFLSVESLLDVTQICM